MAHRVLGVSLLVVRGQAIVGCTADSGFQVRGHVVDQAGALLHGCTLNIYLDIGDGGPELVGSRIVSNRFAALLLGDLSEGRYFAVVTYPTAAAPHRTGGFDEDADPVDLGTIRMIRE